MDTLVSMLGRNGFLPHGYCFTWSPGLLWSMVGADAVIAAAYFSIPAAILSYTRRRPETSTNWLAWLFSAFIFSCGITHVMDIWTIWQPDYALQALSKVAAAAISLTTAIALWPLIPRALKIPSVQQLQSAIAELKTEVGRRLSTEDRLAASQQILSVTLTSIDAGFIATDRDGKVTHMNAVAESVTGRTQRDALGLDLWTVFEREGRPPEYFGKSPVDVILEQGITIQAVHRVVAISRSGTRTPLEAKASLTHSDADGQITGMVVVFRDMSRIVQAEAESSRLAAIVESSNDAIIGKTLEGRITSWNGAAQAIFGYSAEEAIGQPVQMLIPLHQQAEEMSILSELALGKSVPAFDTVRLRRDGEPIDVSITISPIRDGEGRVVGASKIARDVSEQRRARIALRESERRLRSVLDNMAEGLVIFDASGNITDQNPASVRIHDRRLSAEQRTFDQLVVNWRVRKYPDGSLVPPEQWAIPRVIRGERVLGERFFVDCIEDPERNFVGIYSGCSVHDEQGMLSYGFLTVEDITEQARAEVALRDSEERLRFTLEAAHIGDWNLDLATGAALQHSARHDQCFGYAEHQADWNFDKFIEHVHPEDRAEVEQTFHVAVTECRDWRVQCRVIWPDNSVHWISAHGSLQHKGDKATRMLGIVSEITEQRQAENVRLTAQRLEAENRQIQEANRLKSQFLANMSHELRTPLNAVIGFADLLHSGFIKPDSPKHQEFLGHIGTSGRHLLQLINDVLDLSKVESGKFDFFPEHIDLPVLLKEVEDVLHTAVSRKNISISTAIDADLIDLTLDPARLKQVLYNYMSNAIKFTAADGQVMVRAMVQGPEHFRIEVEDTGIGISAADLPRLFTEFQQLDAGYSKQHQGTGLGLALTRRLVQAQGGQVGVRSTVGVGSVFYAVLNRRDGTDMQRAEAITAGVLEREAERVLVIEDDLRDQALLVEALSQAGFEVDAAADSPYALRRARETAYAALTLDLSLPGRRGLELLDDIRSRGASHASPVLGVTMPADLNNSAAFAIANVLCKPIRSDEILSAMARFRVPGERRATVMVIDVEQVYLDLMQATLRSIDIDAVCFQDGRVALQEIDRHQPDAIVLDLMMPGLDGFQVLDALQRLPAWREVPVFIWTSMLLTDEEYATLARSARAILIKGGGAMENLLESVRRWRHPVVAGAGAKP